MSLHWAPPPPSFHRLSVSATLIARFMRPTRGAHLGPPGPRWAPCWPHDPCYLGRDTWGEAQCFSNSSLTSYFVPNWRSFIMESKGLFITHTLCQGWWCPGYAGAQDKNSHIIVIALSWYFGLTQFQVSVEHCFRCWLMKYFNGEIMLSHSRPFHHTFPE